MPETPQPPRATPARRTHTPLDKEGPIDDFVWSPKSLVSCTDNFIPFTPQGRLIALAGFDNLACKTHIFDRRTFSKALPPDHHAPRLRVDSGSKIWHFTSPLVHVQPVEEVYRASWRPTAVDQVAPFVQAFPTALAPSESMQAFVAVQKPAYRPPGALWTNEHRIPPHPHPIHARGPNRASTTFPPFALHCAETPVDSTHPTTSRVRHMYAHMGDQKQDMTPAHRDPMSATPHDQDPGARIAHRTPPAQAAQPRWARTPLATPTKAHPDAHQQPGSASILVDVAPLLPPPPPTASPLFCRSKAPPPRLRRRQTYLPATHHGIVKRLPAIPTCRMSKAHARRRRMCEAPPPRPRPRVCTPQAHSSNTGGQQKTHAVAACISAHGGVRTDVSSRSRAQAAPVTQHP
ncbi:hypothetical protein C8J57DRAFT_1476453 [Mycena rebaudengoi]|nr:hypothetical protein C8J57DRAFT_1476453 [Mycena rebaudengoi]